MRCLANKFAIYSGAVNRQSSGEARGTYNRQSSGKARGTCKQTYMHTYKHTNKHTDKHTYTQIHTHTSTQTRNFSMRTKINFADNGFIIKTLFLWAFLVKPAPRAGYNTFWGPVPARGLCILAVLYLPKDNLCIIGGSKCEEIPPNPIDTKGFSTESGTIFYAF